jgi:hypothetical protein
MSLSTLEICSWCIALSRFVTYVLTYRAEYEPGTTAVAVLRPTAVRNTKPEVTWNGFLFPLISDESADRGLSVDAFCHGVPVSKKMRMRRRCNEGNDGDEDEAVGEWEHR